MNERLRRNSTTDAVQAGSPRSRRRRYGWRKVGRAVALAGIAAIAGGADTTAQAGLDDYLEASCEFDANPWCRLPGDPSASFITRGEALEISRGDEAASKRLWGWGGPKETFFAWGSAATDGERMYFFGGGHHHYRGNDIKVYDFETLSWSRLYDPAYVTTRTVGNSKRRYIPEVGPRATHIYDGLVYSREMNALFMWGLHNLYGWRFSFDVWQETQDPWQAWSRFSLPTVGGKTPSFFRAAVLSNGNILLHASRYAKGRGDMFVFDPKKRAYRHVSGQQFVESALTAVGDRAYGRSVRDGRIDVYDSDGQRTATIAFPSGFSGNGMAHHPGRDLLVLWDGRADTLVYDLRAKRWQQVGTLAENVPQGARRGPYGRWQYLPEHDVFVGLGKTPDGGHAMWAYRLPEPLPEEHPLKQVRQDQGYTCSDEVASWSCPDLQKQVDAGSAQKGVYHQCAKVNSPVDFNGAWLKKKACGRKAALIASDGAQITNVKVTDISIGSNANCVRWEGGRVTIRNMTCRRADMGLLGFGADLVIADSTFAETLNKGRNNGHLIYTCPKNAQGSRLTLQNTTVRAPGDQGHVLKTGCATTRVEGSVLDGGEGNYSRVIDAFNGGRLIIRDSTIAAGRNGGNGDLIGFGAEARQPLAKNVVDLRAGITDCRALPGWGNALHTWPGRAPVDSVTWQPATNHGCRMP